MKSELVEQQISTSIIVLNYFGEKVIQNTIESVLKNSYPKNKFEIIVVDNGSTDLSRKIIDNLAKKHRQIKKLYLPDNLGFAGGNNRGIDIALGKYIILLNNDCLADKNWIQELVTKAESDKNIFSVNSKILLYPKYFDVQIPYSEELPLCKVILTKSNILSYGKKAELQLTFSTRPSGNIIEVPFEAYVDKQIIVTLHFSRKNSARVAPTIQHLSLIKKVISSKLLKCTYKINPTDFSKLAYSKIQNCGNMVFQDGSGRDIGAEVQYMSQNYEKDVGQFDVSREVYSTCGAASLYRKDILDKIGYLDDTFFMYYEDLELCERARLAGYKNVTSPRAIARHLHALSSGEWSPFFIYHVEKGRLLHLLYHFPNNVFISQFLLFSLKSVFRLKKSLKYPSNLKVDVQYFKVIIYFITNFPKLLIKKSSFNKIYHQKAIVDNYKQITTGFWFFNKK